MRLSDTDARLITDLNSIHKVKISATLKDDAEAALHALRNAFQQDKIEIHPDAEQTIAHLQNGVWNEQRSSYSRSPLYGHWDLIDALKYGWRGLNRNMNPFPPAGVILTKNLPHLDDVHVRPEHLKSRRSAIDVVSKLFRRGQPTRVRNGWK